MNTNKKIQAKKEYEKKKFKYQNVCFKIEEIETIDLYCKENNIARNTLIRNATMNYINNK